MGNTFSGGIAIPPDKEKKAVTSSLPVEEWEPDRLRIPLRQGRAPPASPPCRQGTRWRRAKGWDILRRQRRTGPLRRFRHGHGGGGGPRTVWKGTGGLD